jgi:hypothetical protein
MIFVFGVAMVLSQWSLSAEVQETHPSRVDGIVKDSHDASVPGAIILFETKFNGKKFKQKVQSNRDGLFQIELPAGSYRVTVKFSGFHTFKRDKLIIEAGKPLTFDIVLKENPRKVTGITE